LILPLGLEATRITNGCKGLTIDYLGQA